MPFVKLDCGILDSSIWPDKDARDIFITALLMAEPREFLKPSPQINVLNLELTGFEVPPGWYGFVPAAGPGIAYRAGIDMDRGMAALLRLSSADPESRSGGFDGRRMCRVEGGYIILNYMRYREMDYSAADRQKRYRERRKARNAVTRVTSDAEAQRITSRHGNDEDSSRDNITEPSRAAQQSRIAEAEAEAYEEILPAGAGRRPKKTPARNSEFAHLTDHFCERWKKRYGKKYPFSEIDGIKLSELLKAVDGSLVDAKAVVNRFLADDDRFLHGHAVKMLMSAAIFPRFLVEKPIENEPDETGFVRAPLTDELKAFLNEGSNGQ